MIFKMSPAVLLDNTFYLKIVIFILSYLYIIILTICLIDIKFIEAKSFIYQKH